MCIRDRLSLVPNHGSMEPKVLNLKEMLEYYLEHQENVVRRRTQYDLNKAQERAHILEGLLKALDNKMCIRDRNPSPCDHGRSCHI